MELEVTQRREWFDPFSNEPVHKDDESVKKPSSNNVMFTSHPNRIVIDID
jgi:hypothetical protein